MKPKILIFGACGMFGHIAAAYLKQLQKYEVVSCARNIENGISLDVTDFAAVEKLIEQEKPQIVLNAVGVLVKASEDHPDQAVLLNGYWPHFLAKLGKKLDFKLIHISTDCVFSGKKGTYYDSDFKDGDDFYARSKALGEVIDDRNLTVRTSIIGPELKENGTGLFHWFMKQHGEIKGYTKAYWSGVTTLELAKFVHVAIEKKLTGLYQLSMEKKISKYDLLLLFQKIWKKDNVKIVPFDGYFCDKSMVNSVRNDFDYQLPADYPAMLNELKNFQ